MQAEPIYPIAHTGLGVQEIRGFVPIRDWAGRSQAIITGTPAGTQARAAHIVATRRV